MRSVSIKIGARKRNWLAGLQWSSQDRSLSVGEVKAECLHLNGNLFVRRAPLRAGISSEGSRYDVGYGFLPSKNRRGTYFSLGALLSQIKKGRWSATFALGNDLYVYIVALDGNSVDSTDGEVVGSRVDVDKARETHAQLGLAYAEHTFEELEQFVDEFIGEPTKVVFIDGATSGSRLGVAALGVLGALGAAGGYLYWQHHNAPVRVDLARKAALLAKMQQRALAARVASLPPPLPSLLLTLPSPHDLQSACRRATQNLPLSVNGWAAQSLECGPGAAILTWQVTHHALNAGHPPGVVAPDGTSVVSRFPYVLQSVMTEAWRVPLENEVAQLRDLAGGVNAALDIQIPPVPRPTGDVQSTTQAPAPVQMRSFAVKTAWAPWSFPFDQVGGLRIESIKYSSGLWTVRGEVYGL